jgi:hypothetical protein
MKLAFGVGAVFFCAENSQNPAVIAGRQNWAFPGQGGRICPERPVFTASGGLPAEASDRGGVSYPGGAEKKIR